MPESTGAYNPRKVIPATVPDGTYRGIWGGYVVAFTVDDVPYKANTEVGVRTPACPVDVVTKDGSLTVIPDV